MYTLEVVATMSKMVKLLLEDGKPYYKKMVTLKPATIAL